MTRLHRSLAVARWIVAISVAYQFVHAGSGVLTQLALAWQMPGAFVAQGELLGAFGLTAIAASFGLFAQSSPLRVVSASALLLACLAPQAGVPTAAVPGWCVAATAILAFIPRIPTLESMVGGRVLQLAN
jgi:hypothetical protein